MQRNGRMDVSFSISDSKKPFRLDRRTSLPWQCGQEAGSAVLLIDRLESRVRIHSWSKLWTQSHSAGNRNVGAVRPVVEPSPSHGTQGLSPGLATLKRILEWPKTADCPLLHTCVNNWKTR